MPNNTRISAKIQKLLIYFLLATITLAVYWQVKQFDFVNFDDNLYITGNPVIQSGITWEGIRWAFETKYFGLWNPLVWVSFMLDHQLYGLKAGGYHMTNVILHILSTLMLFWLFSRMTKEIWKSAFVAALFALHPLHVESVAWIAERKDVLSAFFWMLTLCLYVRYTEKPAAIRYMPVLFSFVLALLSKPMVVTLPVMMILLDYWPLKRFETRDGNPLLWQLKEKLPFFLLSIIAVSIILFPVILSSTGAGASIKHISLFDRLANAPLAFFGYVAKTFWPGGMAVFYPFPAQIPLWQTAAATLLIGAVSVAVIMMMKRLPHLFVGWLWYAITILPVIGIIQIGNFSMTDRYHYLPSIGIAVMLAWGIPFLFTGKAGRILFPVAASFLITLSFLSWRQCGYWKNSVELWSHAVNVTTDNYMAHNNLAFALLEKGETQQALYHYNRAVEINNYPAAHYNIGVVNYRLGQYREAIERFEKAIQEDPDYAAAHYNLGFVNHGLGRYQAAMKSYNETIRLNPLHADAFNNRALIYIKMGNYFSGCSNAKKACKLGNCKTLAWAKDNKLCD
jgi:hypothetical protein